jgi:8-oxo-dGTP diphosphatase
LKPIEVVTGLIQDTHGRLLVVRKRGSGRFMLPGGKAEPGESPLQTLARELTEEIGLRLVVATEFGWFEAQAANEPDRRVRGHVHDAQVEGDVVPAAEIEAAAWIDVEAPHLDLAPLLEHQILPAVRRRRGRSVRPDPAHG